MKYAKSVVILCLLSILQGCVSPRDVYIEQKKKLDSMTIASIMNCTNVIGRDDKLEHQIKYSTQPCFVYEFGSLRFTKNDQFLRAYKDKKSGVSVFQIYVIRKSDDWQWPYQVNYLDGDELQSLNVSKISSDVECYRGGCTHEEHVGFWLPESYLKNLSDKYESDRQATIVFRLKNKNAADADVSFKATELVGAYRRIMQD